MCPSRRRARRGFSLGYGSPLSGAPPSNPFLIRPISVWRSAEAAGANLGLRFIVLMIFFEGLEFIQQRRVCSL
ncbi:hypothetical protein J5N97_006784 [Dioscorea zingiberensis]|uniref:Uncharacterized protein n=1 Tax=Dioscorea zingiberensis TaxID=325984 RepID=A0A9D5HTV6_9LILI|nr:hypothetical protein J5N97_006784 [Dioscorea zingiberensis]